MTAQVDLQPRREVAMTAYFNKLRATEFKRFERQKQIYLDYAAAGVYPHAIVRDHQRLLYHLLGNPQSSSPASTLSAHLVEQTRTHILHFFNADPRKYTVIFTANATAAIKLIAESFPFRRGSTLVLSADNHDSVNGIQEYAKRAGATIRTIPLGADFRLQDTDQHIKRWRKNVPGLLAYPAQSNFSGVKHPLDLVDKAHKFGYDVLLDAASYVPTNKLDLSQCMADYVTLSFYKMFGYPTGLGALIASKAKLRFLQRPWYSGGTTTFVSLQHGSHYVADGPARFEDGTPNFLSISAITGGLDFLNEVGMSRLSRHVAELTHFVLKGLKDLRYGNGSRIVRIYGPERVENRGAIIAFDLFRKDGTRMEVADVARMLAERGICVKSGLIANAGCVEHAYQLEKGAVGTCLRNLKQVTVETMSESLGVTTLGSIRISLGVGSVLRDVKAFLGVVREYCSELAEQDILMTADKERKTRGASFDLQDVKPRVRRLSLRRRQNSEV